jgi:cell division protein FtsB
MNRFTKLAFLFCVALTAAVASHSAFAATIDEQTSARLDALEKENAALRARLNRLEASKVAKIRVPSSACGIRSGARRKTAVAKRRCFGR